MRPTFIACNARSGSTLLRWLLNAHPQVSCPAETDIAQALAATQRSVEAMWGPEAPTVHARKAMEALIEHDLRERDRRVWCDKSLSNALNLDLIAKAWLGAHFIFLHRHVMDFIASALEAQPFGLVDYGFPAFAGRYQGDDIAALAHYWVERTGRMLSFESKTGHRTERIRYEDLARVPGETMAPLWHLLGVSTPEQDPDEMLSAPRDGHGSGDHLIWYRDRVSEGSVGTGARIPAARITGALRRGVNEALAELGYDQIDDAWGAGGPLEDGVVRIVHRHQLVNERRDAGTPGTIVVEAPVVHPVTAGLCGHFLRSHDVRYYGRPLAGYGEEHDVFGRRLPKILAEMT